MKFIDFKSLIFALSCLIFYGCASTNKPSYNSNNYTTNGTPATMRPYVVLGKRYYPQIVKVGDTQSGIASWYGPNFHGKKTSNGERYDMNVMTAAHKTYPMNTIVRVTNRNSGESAVVRINDRGPFVDGRIIDLSKAAAKRVGVFANGTAPVKLEVLKFSMLDNTFNRSKPQSTPVFAQNRPKIEQSKYEIPSSENLDFDVNTNPIPARNFDENKNLAKLKEISDNQSNFDESDEIFMNTPQTVQVKNNQPPSSIIGGKFMVQVGAFSRINGAEITRAKYDNLGAHKAIIKNLDGMNRVFLTGFLSEDEAIDFIASSNLKGAFIIRE